MAPKFLIYPAPLGAACKLSRHTTWRSSGALFVATSITSARLRRYSNSITTNHVKCFHG